MTDGEVCLGGGLPVLHGWSRWGFTGSFPGEFVDVPRGKEIRPSIVTIATIGGATFAPFGRVFLEVVGTPLQRGLPVEAGITPPDAMEPGPSMTQETP